jgi:hypothetical protein
VGFHGGSLDDLINAELEGVERVPAVGGLGVVWRVVGIVVVVQKVAVVRCTVGRCRGGEAEWGGGDGRG